VSATAPMGQYPRLLYEESCNQLFAGLTTWRIDHYIRQMEAQRRRGRILPFVRGLRFSALLIYEIREILDGTGLTANWGHLIDETGALCSCECDVIIHRRGQFKRWNGSGNPVMDFRFVSQDKAVAVVSCKSRLRSTADVDQDYCELMRPFVDRIWLFAECCGPRSAASIRTRALESGYEEFWFVYTWSPQTSPEPNREGWNHFVEKVLALAG